MARLAELSARPLAPSRRGFGLLERVWEWFRARHNEKQTVRLLGALDDRTLKDIGMDRSEIGSIVYGGLGEPASIQSRRIHFSGRA